MANSPGTRTRFVRLLPPQVTPAGDQVARGALSQVVAQPRVPAGRGWVQELGASLVQARRHQSAPVACGVRTQAPEYVANNAL